VTLVGVLEHDNLQRVAVSDVRAELADIERRRLKALVDADVAAAAELHADDFQLVTPSGATYSKDEYLGDVASGAIDYRVWEPRDIDVHVRGDAGCLRYRSELEIIVAGRKIDLSRYWHTDYYERRDGRWQVVFSHATEIISEGRSS
jgi:ketosteroid isomerase-like protein